MRRIERTLGEVEMTPGCQCQDCGKIYTVDILNPDDLWEEIKPPAKPEGSGLLCGVCIVKRLDIIKKNTFCVFELIKPE